MQPKLPMIAVAFPAIAAAVGLLSCPGRALAAFMDWPSYNNTLTSERYSSLDTIDS